MLTDACCCKTGYMLAGQNEFLLVDKIMFVEQCLNIPYIYMFIVSGLSGSMLFGQNDLRCSITWEFVGWANRCFTGRQNNGC